MLYSGLQLNVRTYCLLALCLTASFKACGADDARSYREVLQRYKGLGELAETVGFKEGGHLEIEEDRFLPVIEDRGSIVSMEDSEETDKAKKIRGSRIKITEFPPARPSFLSQFLPSLIEPIKYTGMGICQCAGAVAEFVLDPTKSLDEWGWRKLNVAIERTVNSEKELLCSALGLTRDFIEFSQIEKVLLAYEHQDANSMAFFNNFSEIRNNIDEFIENLSEGEKAIKDLLEGGRHWVEEGRGRKRKGAEEFALNLENLEKISSINKRLLNILICLKNR